MPEYFVDVVVRLKIQTAGNPEEVVQEADYNFSADPQVGTIVDTEIKDVTVVGTVDPNTGALRTGEEIEEVEALYCNYYRCSECGEEWEDEWDSMCNDRCPKCNAEIEPYMSTDLTTGEIHE
jgi:rubrerythrin